jgi:hypothetical protein
MTVRLSSTFSSTFANRSRERERAGVRDDKEIEQGRAE